eukprot:2080008-Pleurochrysis_carterae.AAC.1
MACRVSDAVFAGIDVSFDAFREGSELSCLTPTEAKQQQLLQWDAVPFEVSISRALWPHHHQHHHLLLLLAAQLAVDVDAACLFMQAVMVAKQSGILAPTTAPWAGASPQACAGSSHTTKLADEVAAGICSSNLPAAPAIPAPLPAVPPTSSNSG